MASQGGYRRPSNPAPVAMPGAMSGRTDGGPADTQPMRNLPNAAYGEAQQFAEIQGGADMAGARPTPEVVPLGADSSRPDEPVTAGSTVGAGPGPVASGVDLRTADQRDAESLRSLLPLLQYLSSRDGASPSTRDLVRKIRSNL